MVFYYIAVDNFDFTRKFRKLKTRKNTWKYDGFYYLAVDNFDFTRKIVKIKNT